MPEFQAIARTLTDALSLKTPPIAVLLDAEAPGIAAFSGKAPAGCQFWQRAASGAFTTTTADHEACAIGTYTHGMESESAAHATDRGDALRVFAELGYVRPEDVPLIPALKRRVQRVTYAPLAETPSAPDVVLLFASAQQGLVVTEAVQQVDGGVPPALGRPACAVIAQAVDSGRAALSLGCCGARVYLDILTDDVALWALPGARLEEYASRIQGLAGANQLLTQFHQLRRKDVESGNVPSVRESLARLESQKPG
jgi:uncharacterized protein (DUF169 family)